jgi:hypothetical protein
MQSHFCSLLASLLMQNSERAPVPTRHPRKRQSLKPQNLVPSNAEPTNPVPNNQDPANPEPTNRVPTNPKPNNSKPDNPKSEAPHLAESSMTTVDMIVHPSISPDASPSPVSSTLFPSSSNSTNGPTQVRDSVPPTDKFSNVQLSLPPR